MNLHPSLLAMLAAIPVIATSTSVWAGDVTSQVDDEWFRAWPPASVSHTFPSVLRSGGARLGNVDTLEFHATYIASLKQNEHFNWLVGADWQRLETSVPAGVPLPGTLQSAAAVLGFDWRFRERWRARLEVTPGVFSDFRDLGSDDFNAPFNVGISYALNPRLLIGGQLSVNARRKSPVLGAVGVRWKFADAWLLSLWLPRPRLEYFATEKVTLFAGAQFVGGTFVVADEFGRRHGRASLDGQPVDFQEIRVGGGVRYAVGRKLALELSGGWTTDRRYNFHGRRLEFKSDSAPYVQLGFGMQF